VPRLRLTFIVMAALAAAPTPAWAHALGAECTVKDGSVQVEAFFSDDSPAVHANIEIRDAREQVIAKGQTDAQGRWSFPAPTIGHYVVQVDAGAGHRARVSITILSPSAPVSETISAGPTRQEFTSFPYVKASVGLGSIFFISIALLAARKKNRPAKEI
jgi:hypothetical protein